VLTIRALAALALGLTLSVSGCAADDQDGGAEQASTSRTDHNDADVAFASGMIQHHAQALAMVDLTMGRDLDPKAQGLAEGIRAAQGPEIETMADWLQDWGEEVPETVRDHSNSHGDMSEEDMADMGGGMPGMMTANEMAMLEQASNSEFQDMWLQMMIEHHKGAIELAQEQVKNGQYKAAVDLAREIESAQAREVQTMESVLN
jgi:uncharacterized protein (DUF305 family)